MLNATRVLHTRICICQNKSICILYYIYYTYTIFTYAAVRCVFGNKGKYARDTRTEAQATLRARGWTANMHALTRAAHFV